MVSIPQVIHNDHPFGDVVAFENCLPVTKNKFMNKKLIP